MCFLFGFCGCVACFLFFFFRLAFVRNLSLRFCLYLFFFCLTRVCVFGSVCAVRTLCFRFCVSLGSWHVFRVLREARRLLSLFAPLYPACQLCMRICTCLCWLVLTCCVIPCVRSLSSPIWYHTPQSSSNCTPNRSSRFFKTFELRYGISGFAIPPFRDCQDYSHSRFGDNLLII